MFYDKLHTMMDKCQPLWDRLILKWLVKNWVSCEKLHTVNRLSGTTHACFIAHFIQCSNSADLYSTLRGCGLNCICAHGSDRFIFTLLSSLTSKMLTGENPLGGGGGNGMRRSLDQARSLTLCFEFLNWLWGPNLIHVMLFAMFSVPFSINTFRFPLGQVKENLVSFHQAYTFYLKMPLVKSKFSFII